MDRLAFTPAADTERPPRQNQDHVCFSDRWQTLTSERRATAAPTGTTRQVRARTLARGLTSLTRRTRAWTSGCGRRRRRSTQPGSDLALVRDNALALTFSAPLLPEAWQTSRVVTPIFRPICSAFAFAVRRRRSRRRDRLWTVRPFGRVTGMSNRPTALGRRLRRARAAAASRRADAPPHASCVSPTNQ